MIGGGDLARLIFLVLVLGFVVTQFRRSRLLPRKWPRLALVWIAIFLALVWLGDMVARRAG